MSTPSTMPPHQLSGAIADLLREVPQITTDLWNEKYRYRRPDGTPLEASISESKARVVSGVYAKDPLAYLHAPDALWAMENLLWNPGGRIQAGAGTDKLVTLINCYVNDDLADSMHDEFGHAGILTALKFAALTQQQGGGIGTPFQTLRPAGALVLRTGSVSSGIIPFMRMWHTMCSTIMSSGSRRGAMMATITDNHPDLFHPVLHSPEGRARFAEQLVAYMNGAIKIEAIPVDFITAKQVPNELTNFNMSVLITHAFMKAVKDDLDWDLGFTVRPANSADIIDSYPQGKNTFYVYNRVKARQIWDAILRSTYENAEPGVIFIDRVNEMNNLWYCERINCTNPCGEQPLPAHGACDLGAVNYAMLVKDPFTSNASFDFDMLDYVVRIGQRFLDNVLDVTKYPLEEQAKESFNKRRTGNGFLGLGTALQMLGVRYGSPLAVELTKRMVRHHRDACYRASIELAKERGPFPLFDREKYLQGKFIKTLPHDIQAGISEHGIRNSVLMTLAPIGNTGIYYHNPSTGGEPDFDLDHTRMVLQANGERKPYRVETFGWRAYKRITGIPDETTPSEIALPDYMTTALQLNVEDHLVMQAACQEYIDASISKTINCPTDMTFEEFQHVYTRAYELGLKGCTTYRDSGKRGSVLSSNTKKKEDPTVVPKPVLVKEEQRVKSRPAVLVGPTYKVPDGHDGSMFITVNIDPDTKQVFEVFLRDNTGNEYVEHAGRTLSLLLRGGIPVKEIRQQLRRSGGQLSIWYDSVCFTSQLQLLDYVVFEQAAKYFLTMEMPTLPEAPKEEVVEDETVALDRPRASSMLCPVCSSHLASEAGCLKCTQCFYSKCG